jgi:hypothetical protein
MGKHDKVVLHLPQSFNKTFHDKVVLHLPQSFNKTFHDIILEFIRKRPIINPSHIWDLLKD